METLGALSASESPAQRRLLGNRRHGYAANDFFTSMFINRTRLAYILLNRRRTGEERRRTLWLLVAR